MRHTAAEDYLKRLIAEGEHERQDFKYEVSDARKIARSLSAFANTSGGRLLVGVKDNGRIAGIDSDEEYYMVQAAAEVCCTPVPNVEMQAVTAAGKTVLIATVHEADDKPVRVIDADGRRTAYVRRADENVLASPVHIRVWEQQRRPTARQSWQAAPTAALCSSSHAAECSTSTSLPARHTSRGAQPCKPWQGS